MRATERADEWYERGRCMEERISTSSVAVTDAQTVQQRAETPHPHFIQGDGPSAVREETTAGALVAGLCAKGKR